MGEGGRCGWDAPAAVGGRLFDEGSRQAVGSLSLCSKTFDVKCTTDHEIQDKNLSFKMRKLRSSHCAGSILIFYITDISVVSVLASNNLLIQCYEALWLSSHNMKWVNILKLPESVPVHFIYSILKMKILLDPPPTPPSCFLSFFLIWASRGLWVVEAEDTRTTEAGWQPSSDCASVCVYVRVKDKLTATRG